MKENHCKLSQAYTSVITRITLSCGLGKLQSEQNVIMPIFLFVMPSKGLEFGPFNYIFAPSKFLKNNFFYPVMLDLFCININ